MTVPTISPIAAAAYARLEAIDGLATYIGAPPPDADVPLIPGTELVAPYAVLYPGAGRAGDPEAPGPLTIGGDMDGLAWDQTIVVAAGPFGSCTWAVDKVRAAYEAPLLVAGLVVGQLVEIVDPGPIQIERAAKPPRYHLSLTWRAIITRGD